MVRVLREDAVGVAELLHRRGHDLARERIGLVLLEPEGRHDHLAHESTVELVGITPDGTDEGLGPGRDLRVLGRQNFHHLIHAQ
jgi:hypothetical protein